MSKLCVALVALLIASPAMATVRVYCEQDTNGGRTAIKYEVTGELSRVRAFALDITVGQGAVITHICNYKTGESSASDKGFGIFPGSIDLLDPQNPDWGDPVAPDTDPGAAGTGLGTDRIIIEMGSLYVGEPNAPGDIGTLCELVVSNSINCTMTITEEPIRGGIVMEDTENPDPLAVQFDPCVLTLPPECLGYFCHQYGDMNNTNTITPTDVLAMLDAWYCYNPCLDTDDGGTITPTDIGNLGLGWGPPFAGSTPPGCP